MTAKTIGCIREMLKEEYLKADEAYHLLKDKLYVKYETEWLEGVLTETEQKLLRDLNMKKYNLADALKDFEQHQW